MNILKLLNGYRTYIVGVGMVCTGIVYLIDGEVDKGLGFIGGGLSAIFLRQGINTAANGNGSGGGTGRKP